MNKKEKYYLEDIFHRFIEPYFSIDEYIVRFERDRISRDYRYVVNPKGDKNRFIGFYLHRREKVDDFELVIIYTKVGDLNFHNTKKLLFLLDQDDLERFNRFYQELIDDLDEKSLKDSEVDFFIPFFFTNGKSEVNRKLE
ncbi:hypothetical protein [Mangrovibacterium sp.]|uniref:hypothetical protein n=1 Tax=Mangrovibacterium sp. TaxID=1961364 RepID=UPI003563E1E2